MADLKFAIEKVVCNKLQFSPTDNGGKFSPEQIKNLSAAIAEGIMAYDDLKKTEK